MNTQGRRKETARAGETKAEMWMKEQQKQLAQCDPDRAKAMRKTYIDWES